MESTMNFNSMAKSLLTQRANPEGVYVDFTVGNGRDTEFLCSLAPNGKVYGFDVLEEAIDTTKAMLRKEGYRNFKLILDGHENVKNYVTEPIDGGLFNLGHYPGGDPEKHTMRYTTSKAVVDAMDLLKSGGVLVITVQPRHPEGEAEGNVLYEILSNYNRKQFGIMAHRMINVPNTQYLYEIIKY